MSSSFTFLNALPIIMVATKKTSKPWEPSPYYIYMSASALRSPRQIGHSTPATGSCAYFEDAYPAQHARLLSEGRLLLYCPSSSGFGAWLFGLQSLVAASVLTERALILACPGFATCGDGRGVERTIRKWFRGRGFDWQPEGWERLPGVAREGEVPVPPSRSHFPDRSSRMSPPVFNVAEWHLKTRWPHPIVYNRTHVSGLLVTDRPSVVKLCAGEHTAPDKFFERGPGPVQNAALFRARTGIEKWSVRSMQCALRAFLEPTAALRRTMGRVVPDNAPFVVMHARLGDGSMQRELALEVVDGAAAGLPQRDRDRRRATGCAGSLCGGARGAAARGGDGHAAGGGARRGERHAHDAQARPASAPRVDGRVPCVRGRRLSRLCRLAPQAPRRARLPARPIVAHALGACRGRRPGKHHHFFLEPSSVSDVA